MTPLNDEHRKYADCLREFFAQHVWDNGMAMIQDTVANGPCLPFVNMCLQICVARSGRYSPQKLKRHLNNGRSRWPGVFAKQLFNIWRSMHTSAAPYINHPLEKELHGSRHKRRILRHGGLQLGREKPLAERASEAAAAVWRLCDNKPVCIWIANFTKRRRVLDAITEDADIECTAFALLPAVGLPHFDGHYSLAQLVHRIGIRLEHLQEANTELAKVLGNIPDGTVNKRDMRVPLDVRRPRARPPQWKPMLLTSHRTSRNKELFYIVRTVTEIQAHTRRDLPIFF